MSEVRIPLDARRILAGDLTLPSGTNRVIVFAHGSGSSRMSPRNRSVSKKLNLAGFGTFLFDLLTEEEAQDRENVFNVPLLGQRLVHVIQWLQSPEASIFTRGQKLDLGLFGASTGAAAALWAAADLKQQIRSIVSRGGRPDLAESKLNQVMTPTLLIVGENDETVLELNRFALNRLKNADLVVVPGATHLFEEPGALEQVSSLASQWFQATLKQPMAA